MNRSSYKKKKNEQKLMERKTISIFFSAKNNQRLGLACVYVFFLTAISKYTSINTKKCEIYKVQQKKPSSWWGDKHESRIFQHGKNQNQKKY